MELTLCLERFKKLIGVGGSKIKTYIYLYMNAIIISYYEAFKYVSECEFCEKGSFR